MTFSAWQDCSVLKLIDESTDVVVILSDPFTFDQLEAIAAFLNSHPRFAPDTNTRGDNDDSSSDSGGASRGPVPACSMGRDENRKIGGNEHETIDNGGPAFPSSYGATSGMKLRDWFAGQALMGFIAKGSDGIQVGSGPMPYAFAAAELAYCLSDAMLAARKEAKR